MKGVNFKATIKKGDPMPCICKICSSVKALPKDERDQSIPENNKCFVLRDYPYTYQPFTNSKRKVNLICSSFSHMRTMSIR